MVGSRSNLKAGCEPQPKDWFDPGWEGLQEALRGEAPIVIEGPHERLFLGKDQLT
jgi:hypothetical protein